MSFHRISRPISSSFGFRRLKQDSLLFFIKLKSLEAMTVPCVIFLKCAIFVFKAPLFSIYFYTLVKDGRLSRVGADRNSLSVAMFTQFK